MKSDLSRTLSELGSCQSQLPSVLASMPVRPKAGVPWLLVQKLPTRHMLWVLSKGTSVLDEC